jgi:hypothetical protein
VHGCRCWWPTAGPGWPPPAPGLPGSGAPPAEVENPGQAATPLSRSFPSVSAMFLESVRCRRGPGLESPAHRWSPQQAPGVPQELVGEPELDPAHLVQAGHVLAAGPTSRLPRTSWNCSSLRAPRIGITRLGRGRAQLLGDQAERRGHRQQLPLGRALQQAVLSLQGDQGLQPRRVARVLAADATQVGASDRATWLTFPADTRSSRPRMTSSTGVV